MATNQQRTPYSDRVCLECENILPSGCDEGACFWCEQLDKLAEVLNAEEE